MSEQLSTYRNLRIKSAPPLIMDEPLIIVGGVGHGIPTYFFFLGKEAHAFFSSATRHTRAQKSGKTPRAFFPSQNLDTQHPLPR